MQFFFIAINKLGNFLLEEQKKKPKKPNIRLFSSCQKGWIQLGIQVDLG